MVELSVLIMKKCFLWVVKVSFLCKYSVKINSVIVVKLIFSLINIVGFKLLVVMCINKKEVF